MGKIKEMAWKYVDDKRDTDIGTVNIQFDCFDMVDAVMYGANAVLSEIENTYNKGGAFEVIQLIRELKGKG